MSSDEASSEVTYASISSDYKELSNVGSPGVIVDGYDRLPMHPVDPPSPDYVPGLEEAEQAPLSPDYVPGPEYLEYLALSDKEIPVEDQHNAAADSPIALSPGYIADSDLEEDPENESEDGPTDYPANGGDDDDDDSSGDDADDKDEEEAFEEDEDEEEEHLAPADSTAAASLVVDPVPSAEETKPFETDDSNTYTFPSEAEVDRLLAIPTPPSSLLTSLSSLLPRIPSPPFPVPSPLTTSPTDAGAPLGYKAAEIRLRTASPPPLPLSPPLLLPPPIILPRTRASMVLMRAAAPSTYILAPRSGTLPSGTPPSGTLPSGTLPSRTPPSGTPPLLPIPLPPLLLPSTKCRADVLEVALPPRKRLCIAPGPRYKIGESSSAPTGRPTGGFRANYGFVGTLDAKIRRDPDREIGYKIIDVWDDPDEIAEEI
ncbi:hypothetical protein Tco_0475382 [Tanacetum coccineum]